jgi:hypothetical protein
METQQAPAKNWFFTYNNYTEESIELLNEFCKYKCETWVFQEEVAPKTGTKHLQGNISLKQKARFSAFGLPKEIHWEKTKKIDAANAYCAKEWSAAGRRWTNIKPIMVLEDEMESLPFKDWQTEIIEMIKTKPDKRSINWYWDSIGGCGKTTFVRHLVIKYNAILLGGKAHDIKHGIADTLTKRKEGIDIIVFNFVRSEEEFISYQAIEQAKDACFFSGKYESGMVVYNTPHIIIFANFEPDVTKLSEDRWRINNITEDQINYN